MKVWVALRYSPWLDAPVTEGVFSSFEKAEEYSKLGINKNYTWEIEEWTLDQGLIIEINVSN